MFLSSAIVDVVHVKALKNVHERFCAETTKFHHVVFSFFLNQFSNSIVWILSCKGLNCGLRQEDRMIMKVWRYRYHLITIMGCTVCVDINSEQFYQEPCKC